MESDKQAEEIRQGQNKALCLVTKVGIQFWKIGMQIGIIQNRINRTWNGNTNIDFLSEMSYYYSSTNKNFNSSRIVES